MGYIEDLRDKRQGAGRLRYRVRYRDPAGRERAKSFARKVDAERFLRHVEADLVRGQWVDPEHGRTTVGELAERWFTWDFDTAAHLWAEGAEEIRQFDSAHRESGLCYGIVRYEDLVDDLEPKLAEILDFLDLDRDRFDFGAAARLPVRGSSAFFGPGRATVNWDPVEKDAAFAPKERWREWDLSLLRRFEWIAGEQLRHFGYQGSPDPPVGVLWPLRQRMLDWRWRGGRFVRRAGYWVQRRTHAARRHRAQGRSGSPGT